MKRGTPNHPKMIDLAVSLKVALPHAVGIMEMLWHFASVYAPNGSLSRFTPSQIAQAVGWTEDPKLLVDALTNRWVDGDMFIHDWPEHCETSVHMKLARSGEPFACGCTPNQSRLPSSDRKGNRIVCARHQGEVCAHDKRRGVRTDGPLVRTKSVRTNTVCALPVPLPLPVPKPTSLPPSGNNGTDVGAVAPKRKEPKTTTTPETAQPRVRTQRPVKDDPTRHDLQPRHMDWVVHHHLINDRRMHEEEVKACELLVRGNSPWSAHTLGSVSDAIDARKAGRPMKNVWSYASGISVGDGPTDDTLQKASHWIKCLERLALDLEAALAAEIVPQRMAAMVKHWHATHPVKAKAVGVADGPFD
jgi:hypothetical protein